MYYSCDKITVFILCHRLRGNLIAQCLFLSPTSTIYFSFSAEIASDHLSSTHTHNHIVLSCNEIRFSLLITIYFFRAIRCAYARTHPTAMDFIVVLTADKIDSFLILSAVCARSENDKADKVSIPFDFEALFHLVVKFNLNASYLV